MENADLERQVRPKRKGRHRPVRWVSLLAIAGIVLVSGTVVADVILVYTTNTGIGTNQTGPFQFANGANYATASTMLFVNSVYPSSSPGPTVTTTISGVTDVPVELLDMNDFQLAATLGGPATIGNVVVPSPITITAATVVCAYAIISTAVPTGVGGGTITGEPAGCSASLPTLGALSGGCQTSNAIAINLLTGTVIGSIAGDCIVPATTSIGTDVLWVSYAITLNGSVSTAITTNSFSIPVTVT
jgi:hypothetical protein